MATECWNCGGEVDHDGYAQMCVECVQTTAGTDDCPTCRDYNERVCGWHSTCLWKCRECGNVRRVGNHPARYGSEATVPCYNHEFSFAEPLPLMDRLMYESIAPPELVKTHNDTQSEGGSG